MRLSSSLLRVLGNNDHSDRLQNAHYIGLPLMTDILYKNTVFREVKYAYQADKDEKEWSGSRPSNS